jgi:hypothetical protein
MRMTHSWFLGCVLCAAAAAAGAQAPPAPATPPQATAPPSSPNTADCAPNKGSGATVGQSGEALGDKLAKSNGVLCPPSDVDPQMRAPTPDNSAKMRVIPPPGTPGGNPNLQPK